MTTATAPLVDEALPIPQVGSYWTHMIRGERVKVDQITVHPRGPDYSFVHFVSTNGSTRQWRVMSGFLAHYSPVVNEDPLMPAHDFEPIDAPCKHCGLTKGEHQ